MGMIIYSRITPTAQSREHDIICVLKLALLSCCGCCLVYSSGSYVIALCFKPT